MTFSARSAGRSRFGQDDGVPLALAGTGSDLASVDAEAGFLEATLKAIGPERRPDGQDPAGSQLFAQPLQSTSLIEPIIAVQGHGLGAVVDIEQNRVESLVAGLQQIEDVADDDFGASIVV